MRKRLLLLTVAMAIGTLLMSIQTAQAYIDPGTTQAVGSIWPIIAPVIAVVLTVFGLMFRPIRVFFASLLSKLLGRAETDQTEADEQSPPTD